jgi:hypothetical protein
MAFHGAGRENLILSRCVVVPYETTLEKRDFTNSLWSLFSPGLRARNVTNGSKDFVSPAVLLST